jgi:hypothetical protein
MDCIKVADKVALYYPATCRSLFITLLQLQFDRSYRMVNTPGGPETIGLSMEITLPYRLHGHQHRSAGPLDPAGLGYLMTSTCRSLSVCTRTVRLAADSSPLTARHASSPVHGEGFPSSWPCRPHRHPTFSHHSMLT